VMALQRSGHLCTARCGCAAAGSPSAPVPEAIAALTAAMARLDAVTKKLGGAARAPGVGDTVPATMVQAFLTPRAPDGKTGGELIGLLRRPAARPEYAAPVPYWAPAREGDGSKAGKAAR